MVEIIIVLGNRTPTISHKRTQTALEYFKSSPPQIYSELTSTLEINKYLLLSGGASNGISKPEGAVMMYNSIRAQGIEKQYCIIEKDSRNTIENLRFSKKIIENMFKTLDYKPQITICTSTFHMKRTIILSKLIFEGYQLQFIHTKENVSKEEYYRDKSILNAILDGYCKWIT